MIVRALFDHETARWVREARSFFTVAEEETADGLLVTLAVRQEEEVLQWLLGWGRHVQVREPESLRRLSPRKRRRSSRHTPGTDLTPLPLSIAMERGVFADKFVAFPSTPRLPSPCSPSPLRWRGGWGVRFPNHITSLSLLT